MKKLALYVLVVAGVAVVTAGQGRAASARNPIIWADVPDVAAIRVGDTYYMASTTMHMSPGLPIMTSKDLVQWELVGYAYDTLVDNEALRLENGRNAYSRGSWAPCLRYHNGTFYASTFSSTSGRTHIYTTADIEKGPWKEAAFAPSLHDHSLFFDDDGRVYMLYGVGDLRLRELERDLSGVKRDGFNAVVIPNASAVAGENIGLRAEGSQMRKIGGRYYVMNITWPRGGMRTQIIHRADRITGPYEGKVILQDQGVAQGCLIDTPDGRWYALLFQDNGSVGRSPWLVPVAWEDGWPVLGVDGKAPTTLDIDGRGQGLGNIVASDEFNRQASEPLPLAWQWNHNPDHRYWSVGERNGYLRLTTGRVDSELLQARNMLTQRTFGPVSSATTQMDVGHMKDGDLAGLIALQRRYGLVGVQMEDDSKSIVMVSAQSNTPVVVQRVPLAQHTVYLRIDCDFRDRTDKAYFYYSLDGTTWSKIGSVLQMAYTLPHFMGYRFGLFNFATRTAGGFVDFDYYRISDELVSAAPFLKEAGLEPKGERFPNWSGLDGHVGGHDLSAMAMYVAALGDAEAKLRMNTMLEELAACQARHGNGYVGVAQCTASENVPALKDVFKDHFLIGGAPNRNVVTGRDPNAAAIAEKHFNTITPENDLKWQVIQPRPGQYQWGPADSFVAFGEKNAMFLVGHTLVWHSQTPRWVFQDEVGDAVTRDVLLARMKDHIMSVVGRYKGRIKGWDVVNEALNENGTLRDSPWLRIIGEGSEDKKYDFIAHAFRWAHEADPDAELYYNDYNLETSRAKCDGAVAIVKHLKSKGLRIDGVGIQLHAGLTRPSVEGLEAAIRSLAATGVKVMITELDIRTQTRGYRGADVSRVSRAGTDDPSATSPETQKKLADKYAEIFSVLLKHEKDITRVTFWGIYDRTSWIGGSPLLFDRDHQPKEAFFAVVKTARRHTNDAVRQND